MIKRRGISESAFFLLVIILFSSLFSAMVSSPGLPEKYRRWLEEEVVYIITPKEREVFLKLQTDRERDIFIEAFWKQRDPTPGTPENEFKEEHYRRLNYANQNFGRGSGKPGWMTDRGRVYIILGPPNNIESYENIMGVYPTQIWFYYGDPRYGLPAGFNVIFFKKEGTGDYILYSPSDHGPQALIADYLYNAKDARDAYQRLYQLSPNLAEQTLTLIPGQKPEPGVIDLSSNRLLATIMALPQKKVEDAYAEAWFRHKDLIEVEYSTNYIRCDGDLWAVRSSEGHYLVHYQVEPAKLSVVQDGSEYIVRFDLNGRISDEQGRTSYQFEKTFPLKLTREELSEIGRRAVSFQDVFALVPGTYTVDLLLKNPLSKEFSSLSRRLVLPARLEKPAVSRILLAYDFLELKDNKGILPFQAGGKQLLSWSRKSFARTNKLVVCFQVQGVEESLRDRSVIRISLMSDSEKVWSVEKTGGDLLPDSMIVESLPLSSLKPAYYSLQVDLLVGNNLVDSRRQDLEISGLENVPLPIIMSRGSLDRADEWLAAGIQLFHKGQLAEARQLLERAHSLRSDLSTALPLAEVMFRARGFSEVIELLKPYDQPEAPAEVVSLLGRAYHSMNQPATAAVYYEQYLNRFGVNLEILNFLGSCYYQMGDKERALNLWEKSLSLNPQQEKLRELVNSLKKK